MAEKPKTKPAEAQPKAAEPLMKGKEVSDRGMAATPTGAATRASAAAPPKDDLQQRIKQRAHEIWEREGRPEGREQAHWQQAEREIRGSPANGVAGASTSPRRAAPTLAAARP